MSQDIDERAYELSDYLAWAVPDATLEYDHTSTTHRFVITRLEFRYPLSFSNRVLQTATLEELKHTIAPAIDRILLGASPRRVRVGWWQIAGTA